VALIVLAIGMLARVGKNPRCIVYRRGRRSFPVTAPGSPESLIR